MRSPKPQTYSTAFALAALLLALALAGVAWEVLNSPAPRASAPDVNNILTLLIAAALAALVVLLLAVRLVRRERAARRRVEVLLDRAFMTADHSGELVSVVNRKGRIEYLNRAAEQATGYTLRELAGKVSRPWLPWYGDETSFEAMRHAVLTQGTFRGLIGCRRKDGTPFLLDERVSPLAEEDGSIPRFVSVARDITLQKKLEERLDFLDKYDPVTGIPNRRSFVEILQREIGECDRASARLAVMVLDLDRFKYTNDLFGAETGDEILRQVTRTLRASIGPGDHIARLGSDEFGIIHHYTVQHPTAGPTAEGIQRALARKMTVGANDVTLTGSLGIAVFPDDGLDAAALHKHADMALSRAKAGGRNIVQYYCEEMRERTVEHFAMEKRLSDALENGEYRLEYQPYCDLLTQQVVGAEALVRWDHPEMGVVPPGRFVPLLEESGRIIDVGSWVLKTACRQLQDWKRVGKTCPLSVNLSHVQFRHKNLVPLVAGTVREMNIDPRLLTLELTESICIQDMDFAVSVLKKLKDTGVSLSIDDFGTGYSSLSYIKKLPVDNLKIDMSFVRDVSRDPDAASIITAITGMARSMNLRTIAEGIETEGQRNILHLLRCDLGQGFLFSPAVAPAALLRMLGRNAVLQTGDGAAI